HRSAPGGRVGSVSLEGGFADGVYVGGRQFDFASATLGFGVARGPDNRASIHSGDADVVHERVEPDVGDKMRVEGQRNAPTQSRRRTRDADRKSTRLNSSHVAISYAVFCLKKKKNK